MSFMKSLASGWPHSPARYLRGALFLALALGLTQTALAKRALADDDDGYEEVADADVDEVADTDPSAVVIYRSKLAPYGQWVDHPVYGTVWVPSSDVVGADFAPYVSSGRWELTEEGDWLWVSDYDWGYIPFHYGRWVWVSGVGWAWIPGRRYAPAWVVWRVGASGYIGWAPMPPAYYWSGGYAVALWAVPPAPFIFCRTSYVFHHHVHTYVVHDRSDVKAAASGTHTYHAAHPQGHHTAASPTLAEAGVRSKDAPKMRTKADPRAIALRHSPLDHKVPAGAVPGSSKTSGSSSQMPGKRATTRTPGAFDAGQAGASRSSSATVRRPSSSRARRVSPIVGQRVEAARGAARTVPTTRVHRPSKTSGSRPSIEGPSVPRPGPAVPRAQPVPQKKKPVPVPTAAPPVRRAPTKVHRR